MTAPCDVRYLPMTWTAGPGRFSTDALAEAHPHDPK
jgi:hypothetical protein